MKKKMQNVVKVPDQAEEEPIEGTTQTQQHEETSEDALSDDEIWEDKEGKWFCRSYVHLTLHA